MAEWNESIGFIGLGKMGSRMAARLIRERPRVHVYDLSGPAVAEAVAQGAVKCASPADVAGRSRVVILMLPDSKVVEQVVLGQDGIASTCKPGTVLVDMTSGDAVVTRRVARALRDRKVEMIDAPVSGGVYGAKDGTLTIMVGGASSVLEQVRDVLALMGKKIVHVGELGNGHIVKALNNFLYASSLLASAEALVVAKKLGVDVKTAVEVFTSSSGTNWALERRIQSHVIPRQFENAMSAALMYKDLVHATNLGLATQTPMLVGNLAREQFCEFVAAGNGDVVDFAIVRKLEAIAGTEIS